MEPNEYRKMAEVEDRMWYYRALHHHIVCSLRSETRVVDVLDAGCGTGGLLRKLKQVNASWRLTGLDFSPLACELARERTGGVVVQGSVDNLPFSPASFDVIISCDVICQVSRPVDALREFYRCVKPGGMVVLTMPAYQWMYSYHDSQVNNLRRYTRSEVNALLVEAGFGEVSGTYWNMLPFPLTVVRRKILPPSTPRSDVKLLPWPVEAVFNGLMALERAWLSYGGRMSFGSSVLTVGRKSANDISSSTP